MTNSIYVIVSLILVLIVVIYILFITYKKTYENYSNANTSSLSPTSYNSTNCKLDSDEVQFPKAYNDFCNTQHTLEDVSLAQPKKNNSSQPLLSLHTIPIVQSSKKVYAYNEFCDISQGSLTNNIPYAYNEHCMTQIRVRTPLDAYNNTYVSPLAILSDSLNLFLTSPTTTPTTSPATTPTTSPATTPTTSPTTGLTSPTTGPTSPPNDTSLTTRPSAPATSSGYGNINGWYSTAKSEYLLDNPITIYYEQMIINYSPSTWKFLHIPTVAQLPIYGPWWNWTSELENINSVIDYLGTTLGKFETHIIAPTPIINPLIWVKKQRLSEESNYKIINTTLENMLLNKINTALPNANIVLTPEEWSNCNITTNIITLHYINVGSSQYRPFSPGTDNVNNESLAIIANDWKIGSRSDQIQPNLNLRVEECGGVCLKYMTKNNRQRMYMAIDLGMGHTPVLYGSWFNSQSNDAKKQWLRNEIYASISHEYTHIFQLQLIQPLLPGIWFGEEGNLGERSPNAISRWWLECFATVLPYFMGFNSSGFDIQSKINDAINKIKNNQSLTATEFSDRMMYVNPYGYLPGTENMVWSFLTAAYMAKLKTWKYVLVDFYYDFQRVPSNTEVNHNGTLTYVPDLDKLFLHNFGKTEEAFLQDIYAKVKNSEITIDFFNNVLPGGTAFGIPGLVKFNNPN